MTTLYFNLGTPQTGLSAVVTPMIGDSLIVSIPQIPGKVRTKAAVSSVAGSVAIPYAVGAVKCSSVVGDWEVRS